MRWARIFACAALLPAAAPAASGAAAKDAAPQSLGGFRIHWPAAARLGTAEPRDRLRVRLVPSDRARLHRRRAIVSLRRVPTAGRRGATIAQRRLRRGSVVFRVPKARSARYRLIVRVGRHRAARLITVTPAADRCAEAGDVQATLATSTTSAQPGQTLVVTLTNTGSACLLTGLGVSWQIDRDGTWTDVPSNEVVPAIAMSVQPGESLSHEATVPADAPAGRYRLVKTLNIGGPAAYATAEITVAGP